MFCLAETYHGNTLISASFRKTNVKLLRHLKASEKAVPTTKIKNVCKSRLFWNMQCREKHNGIYKDNIARSDKCGSTHTKHYLVYQLFMSLNMQEKHI